MPPKKAPAAGTSKKTEQKKKEKVIEVSKYPYTTNNFIPDHPKYNFFFNYIRNRIKHSV